jgi:hypothetical protein
VDVTLIIFILIICVLIFATPYLRPLFYFVRSKRAERSLRLQVGKLDQLYGKCVFIITVPLGKGVEPKVGIAFSDAHRNQQIAVSTVISLCASAFHECACSF